LFDWCGAAVEQHGGKGPKSCEVTVKINLTDPDLYSNGNPYAAWRWLRALVDDWFTPRSIRLLDAEMRDIAHDVVTRALERESCDFVAEIACR
jgi:cytochrome P450